MVATETNLMFAARAARETPGVRIELALNLEKWAHLADPQVEALTWFHQYVLDRAMTWGQAAEALGYHSGDPEGPTIVLDALRGGYTGDWVALTKRIQAYRKIAAERAGIQHAEFRETPISKMIWSGIDYALAANCIVIIEGDSGHGKTIGATVWNDTQSKGRGVLMEAPAVGGTGPFIEEVGRAVGYQRRYSPCATREAVFGAFSADRVLIIDEATRLLPKGRTANPDKLEFLRELHDRKRVPLVFLTTRRFVTEMEQSNYVFEQILGRCMPIRLPAVLEEASWRPILVQYFPKPSRAACEAAEKLANNRLPRQKGRVRLLTQVLKLATRLASKEGGRLTEDHFFKALALREQMIGTQAG